MKAEKNIQGKKLPKGFEIDPALNGKYKNEPLFKDKVEKANLILRKTGIPKL